MQEFEADITRTECIGNTTYLLEFKNSVLACSLAPGQFLQLKKGSSTDPFLRRTVSVNGVDRKQGTVRLLIDVIGPGTHSLCSPENSGAIQIIGPLGNSYDLSVSKNTPVILVAGGIGAAPLIFLANELHTRGIHTISFLMGARNADGARFVEQFLPDTVKIRQSTDDGSYGHHGFVTELLEDELATSTSPIVYTCGPKPMMKRVASISLESSIRCQVSLEERMACGIGACYGCAVELKNGTMARVCVDGPVFESDTLVW